MNINQMPKLTKKLISNDVPSKISFTRKSALHLPTAPCTFQNLAGTLLDVQIQTSIHIQTNEFHCRVQFIQYLKYKFWNTR